jgi:hypothetical protein
MLGHALRALAQWDEAGYRVPSIAVNFAPEELRNPRLPDKVQWELDRYGLSPDRLTVEILETVVAQAADDVIVQSLARLADLGCRIDLDDFGTGQASISSIRRFAVTRIKIDRCFVTRLDEDREQQRLVVAPSFPWPNAWAWRRSPKASRPAANTPCWHSLAATMCKATRSPGRCPPIRSLPGSAGTVVILASRFTWESASAEAGTPDLGPAEPAPDPRQNAIGAKFPAIACGLPWPAGL